MSVFKIPQHLDLVRNIMVQIPELPARFTEDTFGTIEALRPFLRLVREERIVPVGSHVTTCTLCDTSWLLNHGEHHEENCLFYGIPKWLAESED